MKLHDYNQMMGYMKRRSFANGSPEPTTTFNDKIETLKEASPGLMPRSRVAILKGYMDEALKDGEITQEQHTQMLMPYFGELGENVTEHIEISDRENFSKGGYKGYVSSERLELEKKIPEIRRLFLEGNSILDLSKKLNVDGKKIETILNECFTAIEETIENEKEYRESDEAIIEDIEANEYEFLKNGNIY